MIRALLIDGPDEWAGQVVTLTGTNDTLERRLPDTPDDYVMGVWRRSGTETDVRITFRTKGGVKSQNVPAEVWTFDGERRVSKHVERRQAAPQQMTLAG